MTEEEYQDYLQSTLDELGARVRDGTLSIEKYERIHQKAQEWLDRFRGLLTYAG